MRDSRRIHPITYAREYELDWDSVSKDRYMAVSIQDDGHLNLKIMQHYKFLQNSKGLSED
jgi:hypothetical protein